MTLRRNSEDLIGFRGGCNKLNPFMGILWTRYGVRYLDTKRGTPQRTRGIYTRPPHDRRTDGRYYEDIRTPEDIIRHSCFRGLPSKHYQDIIILAVHSGAVRSCDAEAQYGSPDICELSKMYKLKMRRRNAQSLLTHSAGTHRCMLLPFCEYIYTVLLSIITRGNC